MPAYYEADQEGKRESLADIIANVQPEACPVLAMMPKRKKPNQSLHEWQVEAYPDTGHTGVPDGLDAETFTHIARERVRNRRQKMWYLPAVSDMAEETVIAGLKSGEMSHQIARGMTMLARMMESRLLSNNDNLADTGAQGNETRGLHQWIQNGAQALNPVPADFRTPSAAVYSGTLANFTETQFRTQCAANYKERKGQSKMTGLVGVDLKQEMTLWSVYTDDVSNKTQSRTFNQDAKSRALINVIDRLVMDTGEYDLHLTTFQYKNRTTGADTAQTHRSGLFLDMEMCGLAYTRMPRVVKLEYRGGGHKAIIDVIILTMVDNPLSGMACKIAS